MKRIDFHAHIFPDKIAVKASANVGAFYNIPMNYDGKVSTLLQLGDLGKIDCFVVHSVATVPEQVENINNFIISTVKKHAGKFIGFATIHPDYHNIETEINRIITLGFKGIKIHPDFQRFEINSIKACKIYEIIEGRLPILIHTGDYRYEYSKPDRLAQILDMFPRLDVIGAHFGGWSEWDIAARTLSGKNIYVDTSSSLYALTPQKARQLINAFGIDYTLFGSDYPMWNPVNEIDLLEKISLTYEETEKIMFKNAERLLKLHL